MTFKRWFALVCSLGILGVAMAQDKPVATRYSLNKDHRFFGFDSGGSGSGNAMSVIPFDKTYDQLTTEQQARVKSFYVEVVEVVEGDEPPFPLEGLRGLYRPITAGQQRMLVKGRFRGEAEIGSDGRAVSMQVFESPNDDVTQFVSGVVLLSKFKPARCQGRPCPMSFPISIEFAVK